MKIPTENLVQDLINQLSDWQSYATQLGSNPDNYLRVGCRALDSGYPSLAYEIFNAGLRHNPAHIELTYRAALALARCRSSQTASDLINALLESLPDSNLLASDIYSLAGRLAKDKWELTKDIQEQSRLAQASTANYRHAYKISKEYYPGINAATMSFFSGDTEFGMELASRIKQQCLDLLSSQPNEDYWLPASLGEACLLLGQQQEALKWYLKAKDLIKDNFGSLASIKRQVKLLSQRIEVDAEILKVLKIPTVVVFSGHMIDHPDRLSPRFPPVIQPQVKNEITDALERIGADFGYSSAACGADILFIEAMLERSAEINIVLPFNKADFIETSVRFAGPDWLARFDRVMEKAKKIYYATEEGYLNDDVLFNYGAAQIFGMGILRAKQLESDVLLLSVADSGSEIQTGGTLENIFSWKDCGYETELIDLSKIRNQAGQYNNKQRDDTSDNLNVAHPHAFTQAVSIARDIRTMLFADVVGFSKIGEAEAPSFFVDFLNEIADMIHSYPVGPAFYNTWGDGLFLVYQDIEAAADIALLLRDTVKNKDWQSVGLPEETSIRIGMHAGPVYSAHDPIVNRQNYYGSHVNRAARIEPVTTPGSVFISEQTACLLALTNNDSFTCDYLGPIDLAKKYGSGVLYRLRRKNEIE